MKQTIAWKSRNLNPPDAHRTRTVFLGPSETAKSLLLACVLALSSVIVHASTYAQVSGAADNGSQVVQSSTSGPNLPLNVTVITNFAASYPYGSITSSAAARVSAEVGMLRLDAEGIAKANYTISAKGSISTSAYSEAQGSWDDTLTLNADPSHFGKLGSMTVTLYIGGSLSVDGYSSRRELEILSQCNDTYGTNNTVQGGTQVYVDSNGALQLKPLDGALIGPGTLRRVVYFHFGRPIYIKLWATASAYADADAWTPGREQQIAQATSDLGHTMAWGGISDVRDAGGVPLTVTNVSNSGYNYLAPVITRIQAVSSGLALEWTDLGLRSYTIETSSSLAGGTWIPVSGVSWPIQANSVVLPRPAQSPAFFRVKVQ